MRGYTRSKELPEIVDILGLGALRDTGYSRFKELLEILYILDSRSSQGYWIY